MAFKDWSYRLRSRLNNVFGGNDEQVMQPNMANGGTGGYRPGAKDVMGTRSMMLNELNGSMNNEMPHQPAWQQGEMNNAQSYQNGYADPNAYPGAAQGMNNGYTAYPNTNGYQNGYSNMNPSGNSNGYGNGYQTAYQTAQPGGNGYAPAGYQQITYPNAQMAQTANPVYQPTDAQQPVDNISYMNNQFRNENGTASRHVERVTAVSSLSSCFRVIEFLRNGESVIVNLEAIAVESEVQRILDLLAGAAFTLDVSLTRITVNRRAYLLAPATVSVMQEESLKRASEYRSMAAGQVGGEMPMRPQEYGRGSSYAGPVYGAR